MLYLIFVGVLLVEVGERSGRTEVVIGERQGIEVPMRGTIDVWGDGAVVSWDTYCLRVR